MNQRIRLPLAPIDQSSRITSRSGLCSFARQKFAGTEHLRSMSATISEPFLLSSYGLSKSITKTATDLDRRCPYVCATHGGGYATVTAQGDGLHVLDVSSTLADGSALLFVNKLVDVYVTSCCFAYARSIDLILLPCCLPYNPRRRDLHLCYS